MVYVKLGIGCRVAPGCPLKFVIHIEFCVEAKISFDLVINLAKNSKYTW